MKPQAKIQRFTVPTPSGSQQLQPGPCLWETLCEQIIETCGLLRKAPRPQMPDLEEMWLWGVFTGSYGTLESQPPPCPTLLPHGISPRSHRRLRPNSRLGSSPAVMDGDLLSYFTHRIIPRPKQMAGYSGGSTKHQRKEFSGAGHGGRRRSLDGSQRVCISCLPRGKRHLPQCEQSLVAKPPAPASDRGRGSLLLSTVAPSTTTDLIYSHSMTPLPRPLSCFNTRS